MNFKQICFFRKTSHNFNSVAYAMHFQIIVGGDAWHKARHVCVISQIVEGQLFTLSLKLCLVMYFIKQCLDNRKILITQQKTDYI